MDLLARYGGEEFVIILPNTNRHDALEIAERVRTAIEEMSILVTDLNIYTTMTVSLGVATMLPSQKEGYYQLINNTDIALYEAKNSGRNKTICFN
jgi:diguanylate cyclase (GGDEF)-like protein